MDCSRLAPRSSKAEIIPTFGFNLKPLYDYLNGALFRRLLERARAQGGGKAPEEPTADTSEDDD